MKRKLALVIVITTLLMSMMPTVALAATHNVGNGQTLNLTTGALTATQSGAHITTYTISDGDTVSIAPGATATITGSKNVMISCGSGVKLTITNLNINVSGLEDACALAFTGTGNTLTLVGVSTLESSDYMPGIRVEVGTDLTIGSVSGGEITANGGRWCAGIGGGWHGAGGNITITGGTVTANGKSIGGAGIGGGDGGAAGNIMITDGTVTATSGAYSAGIGGGRSDQNGGSITITGGTVTATGGGVSTGIGGGQGGAGGTIEITGGIVTAKAGGSCTGIGSGWYGSGTWDIDITGGEVYTDGDTNNEAMDIGHSRGSGYDDLNISGNAVVFTKDLNPGMGIVLTTDYHELHWQESIVENSPYGSAYGYTHIPDDWSGTAYAYKLRTHLLIDDAYIDYVRTNIDFFNCTITDVNNHPYLEKIDIDTTQDITIKDSNTTARSIQIEGITSGVQLTIEDLALDVSGTQQACALAFTGTGNTLTLVGDSVLTSWGDISYGGKPGIRVETGTILTIRSTSGGKVIANGGYFSAGIGGGCSNSGGYTNITSGTVVANGGEYGAGIGSGMNGYSGSVNISGGMVYAGGDDSSGVMDIGYGKNGNAGPLDQLVISGDAAVFLKNDSCIPPATSTHTHELVTTVTGNHVHGVSANGWAPNFGVYMRLCTLEYSANQGTGSVPTSVTQHMGTTTTVGNNSGLSRAGYTLGDWNTVSNGGGDSYTPGDDIVLLNDTITLYAEWNPISVTGVTVSRSTATLILGDGNTSNNAVTLTATVSPEDAADKSVSWSSSDSTVASVSGGVVTAHKAGTATITVRTTDGSFEDTCSITVEQKVTGVTLSPSSQTLTLGDADTSNNTVTLTATVSPDGADDKSVSWFSSDSSVASVSGGVVTAHKAGTTTITVTTTDGSFEDTCSITVEQKVTGVSLSSSSETLILGDGNTSNNTVTLTATVSPDDATDKSILWSSSDSTVASVSGGVVTAHKAGNVAITVRTTDSSFEDTCAITVEQKVSGVSLSSLSETLTLGDADTSNDTVTLIATVSPDDATDKSVSWLSSDSTIASVSGGVVTAHKAGNVTITVRTTDGNFTNTCSITVEQKVTGVTVLPVAQTLILGDGNPSNDSVILTATVSPDDADNKSIIWSCDNSIVAQVTPIDATTCQVSAKAVGDAIITVTTADGSYQDTCQISVIDNTVYPGNDYGMLKGTLTGPGNVPQDGRFVKLYSTPATTITDPNGNFTFYNVQYSHHTLVLKTQTGVEFDRYILDFVEGSSTGYSQSGNTITINYTRYTSDLQLVFNSDDTTSTLSDVVFTEVYIVPNPETGDAKKINYNLLAPILYVLIMMLVIILIVYIIRRYKLPVVVDEKNIDIE